jgi:hypothetical protein
LSFHCPSETQEYIKPGAEPFVIDKVENLCELETKLLDEDGRINKSNRPNGNVSKSIRIIRGGKDIGSLFDVRMTASERSHRGMA